MTHAALKDLVKKWQDRAERITERSATMMRDDACSADGKASGIAECADELSAALSAMEGEAAGVMLPYVLGRPYKTQGGESVTFVSIVNAGTDYECMADAAGVHRYTRRVGDMGRVTGSPHDYSDPRNVPPIYTAPPPQQAVGEGEKCPDCGDSVEPNPDAEGKTRCADCWGKNLAATNPTPSPGPQEVTLCEKHGATWVRGCDACNDDLEALSATEPYATPPQPEAADVALRKALAESFDKDFGFWSSPTANAVRAKLWPLLTAALTTSGRDGDG